MTSTTTLLSRNQQFAKSFTSGELPILPKLRTVIIACTDARVDPAHVLGLELGDAAVIRNAGGRVTRDVIDELATLAFMVAKMDGGKPGPFQVMVLHHTQCGAERFANPEFQGALMQKFGIDVSSTAIQDHDVAIRADIDALREARELPGYVIVSAYIYDVKNGAAREVIPPSAINATN